MSFSQGWDTGFKALLIYIGCIFFWLIFLENWFANTTVSVWLMNIVAVFLATAFFIVRYRSYVKERHQAELEVARLLREVA